MPMMRPAEPNEPPGPHVLEEAKRQLQVQVQEVKRQLQAEAKTRPTEPKEPPGLSKRQQRLALLPPEMRVGAVLRGGKKENQWWRHR